LTKPRDNRATLIGWIVVAIAAVLRLGWLDLAPYQYDEADVMLRVFDMYRGSFPLSGAMTSWGVPDPPYVVYFAALVAWLPPPTLAAAGLVAVLNVIAVGVTYVAVLRHFGLWVALASGLLFAVNPWAVYFGRRFWTEILPVFTAVAFLATLEITQRRDPRWLPILGAALATQIQARLLGGLYLPAAMISTLPVAWRWGRQIVLSLAIVLAISSPFIIYVVHSFDEITRALREGSRGLATEANAGLLDLVRWTISGEHLLPFGNRGLVDLQSLGSAVRIVASVTAALLIVGAVLCLVGTVLRKPGWTRYPILLLWAVTPIALLAGQTSSLYLHYLMVLWPFPSLVMGLTIGWLMNGGRLEVGQHVPVRSLPRGTLRLGGALLLMFVVSVQSSLTLTLYSTLRIYDVRDDERQTPAVQPQSVAAQLATSGPRDTAQALETGEFYGIEVPMRYWLEVRSAALRLAGAMSTSEVLVLTEGTNPAAEEKAALVEGMLGPQLRGRYLHPLTLAIPLGRPSLVLETWALDPAEPFQRLGERLEIVPLPTSSRTSRDGIRFYRIPARTAAEWSEMTDRPLDISLGGARLVGARGPERARVGENIQLVSFWLIQPGSELIADTVTVRLIDERGQRVASADLELSEDLYDTAELLGVAMRHDLDVSSRATPGEHRFEVSTGRTASIAARTEVMPR
jgi:hypothetical protein